MTLSFVTTLWIVWGASAFVTVLFLAYRSTITRDEEGQIFLDEAFAHEKAVQTAITSKVSRLQPILRTSQVLTGLLTLAVVGYYAWTTEQALFG